MTLRRYLVPALLLAALALGVVGCGSPTDTPPSPTATPQPITTTPAASSPTLQPSPSQATTPQPSDLDLALQYILRLDGTVLARVNGEDISWEDYEPGLRAALTSISRQYKVDWQDPANQQRLRFIQNDVLQQTVDRWLLRQMAEDMDIALDQDEFQAQLDAERTQILNSGQYADWDDFLQKNGLTDNSFRSLIHDTFLLNLLLSQQQVDAQGEQTHIRHIVVTDQATAQQIYDQLSTGADFAQLAAQYSIDEQTKNDAGDLGWFSPELMSTDIKPIADALAPGEFSQPIETRSGYAIIMVVERALRDLDQRMLTQRQQDAVMLLLEDFRAAATIEILVDFAEESTTP